MLDTLETNRRIPKTSFGSMTSGFYARTAKRLLDLLLCVPLFALSVLPMLVVAIVIRLDSPGNPIFLQKRVGRRGEEFTMWKFRTMSQSPSDQLVFFVDDDGRKQHKIKNDPRVTRVGRILRKTSLDELPQLLNVIVGHMSLVGPRPELPQIVANYEPWQHARHAVRPGITGWWQVSGRSDLPMHEHTELDTYYVENLSLKLDAEIMKKTVVGVIRGIGAY